MTRRPTSDRRRCQECNRWAMAFSDYCYDHNPEISDEERHAARVKGGRASRTVHPLALPEIERIDDTADLKQFTVSVIKALVAGTVTPNQARALFTGALTLRNIMELELYQELTRRVEKLEGPLTETQWQLSES